MDKKIDLSGVNTTIETAPKETGEIRTIGSKEVGESPEEKAQKEQELNDKIEAETKRKARLAIIKTFKTQLLQVDSELKQGKTMDDILNEINEKKSRMSRSTRDFCLNFEKDAILGLLKDLEDIKNGKIKV